MLVLRTIRECYPKAWGRYGFVDAFNPLTGWYNPDVLGIDLRITMLMAENARSGCVWDVFMKNLRKRSERWRKLDSRLVGRAVLSSQSSVGGKRSRFLFRLLRVFLGY
jgi:Putative glucoamylase